MTGRFVKFMDNISDELKNSGIKLFATFIELEKK